MSRSNAIIEVHFWIDHVTVIATDMFGQGYSVGGIWAEIESFRDV